jgi:hypothetical protein
MGVNYGAYTGVIRLTNVKELVPGLARTTKETRGGELPQSHEEVTYDVTGPEDLFLTYPWPR